MNFRLPHVLCIMGLLLAAGILSVQQLEARRATASVPGLVVIDAPWADGGSLQPVIASWPGARLFWTDAGDAPLSPFGAAWWAGRADAGSRTLTLDGAATPEGGPQFATRLPPGEDGLSATRALADRLVDESGTLPFAASLPLGAAEAAHIDEIVRMLVLALDQLPSFRRSSIVVLGAREAATGRRLALRVDRGRWPSPPRPGLADLLEDAW